MTIQETIKQALDEELGVMFPDNPTGHLTELMNDAVLDRLAAVIADRITFRYAR